MRTPQKTERPFYTNVCRLGDNIGYVGYTRNGFRIQKRIPFKPKLYQRVDEKSNEVSKVRSIFKEPLREISFASMNDAYKFVQENQGVEGSEIHGMDNFLFQFTARAFPDEITFNKNNIRIHYFDIEVEMEGGSAEPHDPWQPVISIAAYDPVINTMTVWGLEDYDMKKVPKLPNGIRVVYKKWKTEEQILRSYLRHLNRDDVVPDMMTGWNIDKYDIPYLVNRMKRLIGESETKKISPWRRIREKTCRDKYSEYQSYDILGVSVMDFMKVFKKFGHSYGPQESHSLDHISNVVLGESKMSYEEYGSLSRLYRENFQKFIDYNIKDTLLVWKIEEKTKFLELVMMLAYKGGVNFQDTLGTVGFWDSYINRNLIKNGMTPPPKPTGDRKGYKGGYVKPITQGRHKWVTSFDLASLYPNIIIQLNISPETLVSDGVFPGMTPDLMLSGNFNREDIDFPFLDENQKERKKKKIIQDGFSISGNGFLFSTRHLGIVPKIMKDLFDERKTVKRYMFKHEKLYEQTRDVSHKEKAEELHNRQMTIKIALNSAYGAFANAFFRYFDVRIASGITTTAQVSVKTAEHSINGVLNGFEGLEKKDRICAMDTDSCYVVLEDVVSLLAGDENPVDFCKRFSDDVLYPEILKGYQDLFVKTGGVEQRMDMEREVISEVAVWCARKKYFMHVWDKENVRYNTPKMKVTGMESVRKSETPLVVAEALQDMYEKILVGDVQKAREEIDRFRDVFYNLPVEDIAMPRSSGDIKKYGDGSERKGYKKGTPIGARSTINHNKYVKRLGLDKTIPPIQIGDRCKSVFLKSPNPVQENIISFSNFLPKEFGLHDFVDRREHFQKTYMKKVEDLFEIVDWEIEEVLSVEDLL